MKAIYTQTTGEQVELDVLKQNGTAVDLGRDKQLVIKSCPLSDEAKPGHATLIKPDDAKAKAEADAKKTEADAKK